VAVIARPDSSVLEMLKADLLPNAFETAEQQPRDIKVCSPENESQKQFSGFGKPHRFANRQGQEE